MEKRLLEIEAQQQELSVRIAGLEYLAEESVVHLVGALVSHLAKNGRLNLKAFEDDLKDHFDPDLTKEDSTGILYSRLADLVSFFRQEGLGGAGRETVQAK